LTEEARRNAKFFDLVLAGSSWAVDQLKVHGIQNVDVLVQGIDEKKFHPVASSAHDGFFVFSGGKFELRKSQDLVLKAIKILQEKYSDIFLVNAWVNFWPASMGTMSYSPHIRYEYREGEWESVMNHIYEINGLNPEKIITCEIVPHEELINLYAKTDIGVFPNRSEGGTNLVLMEYMACGKPVVASNCTGHRDIVNSTNSLLLENLGKKTYRDDHGRHFATWDEPDLDELVEKIEYAYLNRENIHQLGFNAGEDLKNFTWERMAENLVSILKKWSLLN
jgi:glycosyltransferase involved in cell wall biosynthesis